MSEEIVRLKLKAIVLRTIIRLFRFLLNVRSQYEAPKNCSIYLYKSRKHSNMKDEKYTFYEI